MFHSELLRIASTDPLTSQTTDDTQPDPVLVGDEEEYEVEKKQYLVKWTGYAKPTWEPASAIEDTTALEAYEQQRDRGG